MMIALPTTVAKRRSVGSSETTTTTATTTAATTTAATPTAAVTTAIATAAATVANHLSETGINLLFSLSKDFDQVASLLRV